METSVGQQPPRVVSRQTRRAWVAMTVGLLLFLGTIAGIVGLGTYYFRHATAPETAAVTVISGSGALIRAHDATDWTLITDDTTISEGDELSTALGTVLWVTLFDGSTVEVSEDTVLEVARMRSSRFFDSTKHIVLRPRHGTIYVAMAPHGDYEYSELTVDARDTQVTMTDGPGRDEVGSFLVEVQTFTSAEAGPDDTYWVRAAVLRGAATLKTEQGARRLLGNEQVRVDPTGAIGEKTPAVRQLIADGSFNYGLSNWVEFHDATAGESAPTRAGSVELVNDWIDGEHAVAVELSRSASDGRSARTGIRQRIGQTLRVYSSVRLEFQIKVSTQEPLGGGTNLDQFPLVVELNYVDVVGEERKWSRSFYALDDPALPVPNEVGSRLDVDRWEHVIFDLRNLSPLPRQITSIVVYASGQSYRTMVTNVSLTSSELGQTDL